MMIVVDGTDGVGKSTLSRNLATHIGNPKQAITHSENTLLGPVIKNIMREEPLNLVARTILYASNLKYTLEKITYDKLCSKDTRYVFDRYIYPTLASHKAMSICLKDSEPLNIINKLFFVAMSEFKVPNATFFLYANNEERAKRVESRHNNTLLDRMSGSKELEQELYLDIAKLLRDKGATVYEIDTTKLTADEVNNISLELLRASNMCGI